MVGSPNLMPTDSRRPSYASSASGGPGSGYGAGPSSGGGGSNGGPYLSLNLSREGSSSSGYHYHHRDKPTGQYGDYGGDGGAGPGPSSSYSHSSGAVAGGSASAGGSGVARRRKSGLKRRTTQLMALRFGWIVLVIWYEAGEFFSSLSSCKFPDSVLRTAPNSPQAMHLVVLADPHVPHPRLSYPPGANRWVSAARQAMEELFMRKSWNVVMRLGRVDGVIVAGDMLDCGRGVMTDDEYDQYVRLFRSIFRLPPSIPMHYVPGNHDLPLGPNKMFSPHARDRYKRYFSPPNLVLDIANHSLILLDSVGLVEEDYRRYAAEMQFGEWDGVEGGVIEFVKEMGDRPRTGPNILISHIPLARQEAATCGPLRERGRIVKGAGPGYRNLLGSETSRFLLQELKPSVVLSGDDHDYCEHIHADGTREVTIKSFSTTSGIRRPGFQLLSLIPPSSDWVTNPTGQITHADRPCLLPDQLGVYTRVYLPVAILTVLYLLFTNARTAYKRWGGSAASSSSSAFAEKAWKSPGLTNHHTTSVGTTATALFDRPVPYSLPSRRSNVSLNGLSERSVSGAGGGGGGAGTRSRLTSYGSELLTPTVGLFASAHSAPVSPNLSPRPSFCDDYHDRSGREEADIESTSTTPSLSRRSSYVWMNSASGHGEEATATGPPPSSSSYFGQFSAEPGQYGGPGAPNYRVMPPSPGVGLGLGSPHTPTVGSGHQPTIRRVTSHYSPGSPLFMTPPANSRKNTMPRMVSLPHGDWAHGPNKDKRSVLGILADVMPVSLGGTGGSAPTSAATTGEKPVNVLGSPLLGVSARSRGRRSGIVGSVLGLVGGVAKWAWRTRNGLVLRTGREVLGVAWPAALVWLAVNALFFWK